MYSYEFECRQCGGPSRMAFNFCPWCGIEIRERARVRGRENANGQRYTIESFRRLLQPIIDLNGSTWVADRVGVDESHVRAIMQKQKFSVSEAVAEKWLIKLGIDRALYDGSLELTKTAKVPPEPTSIYIEE